MEYKIKRQHFFEMGMLIISIPILLRSIFNFNISSFKDAVLFVLVLVVNILISLKGIKVGEMYVDLSDATLAFIFFKFNMVHAMLFQFLSWIITVFIDEKIYMRHKNILRHLTNISMFTVSLYMTSEVMNYFLYYTNGQKILNIIFVSIGFVGIFLLFNTMIIIIDISLQVGRYFSFDKEARKFLLINLMISVLLTAILCIVNEASGMLGTVLMLINILITHYCIYIYKRLYERNESVKSLFKITCDIVKYGDFIDKCRYMLESLKDLIPYTLCAIYTFNLKSDNISYPVVYNSKNTIDIGDLGLLLTDNSIISKIVKNGKIYICKDIKKDNYTYMEGDLSEIVSTLIFVPIVINNNVEGLILIGGSKELIDFTNKGIDEFLSILSNQMALAIENDTVYKSIKNKAEIDTLTKLYNRRVFNREIQSLIKTNTTFSIAIFDIDNFKRINDTYGHLVGDEVLECVSAIIQKSIRKTDVACRYGGEEIVIIFKDLAKEDAYIISDRIRKNIENTVIHTGVADISVTVSGGISSFPEDGFLQENIVDNADKVLYSECKLKGKNKVFVYRNPQHSAL